MIKIGFSKAILKLKTYVMSNWGSPFIIGFIILLVSTIVSWSDAIAVYSYYSLFVGVVLQFVCFLKDEKKIVEAATV